MKGFDKFESMEIQKRLQYVLDFDDTIVNSSGPSGFKEIFFEMIARNAGKSVNDIKQIYEDFKSQKDTFSGDWLDFFVERLGFTREFLISVAVDVGEKNWDRLIYDDFKMWFEGWRKHKGGNNKIVILTAGPEDFQRSKVESILRGWLEEREKYFEIAPVSSLSRKVDYLEEIARTQDLSIVFVDDKRPEGANNLENVRYVQIIRTDEAKESKESSQRVITSFDSLVDLLNGGLKEELSSVLEQN